MPRGSYTPVIEIISTRIIPIRSHKRLSYRCVAIIGHISHRYIALISIQLS